MSKNCNRLLLERVIQQETNVVTNAQYHCQQSVKINPVPTSISELEQRTSEQITFAKHFLWLVMWLNQMIYRLVTALKKETVIVKLKCYKQKRKVLIDRENIGSKSEGLHQLKFFGKPYVSENMCKGYPLYVVLEQHN